MTLEDFFTLTEMKDGLTVPARVEELVSVMKKEKDSLVKNVGDATRQWAAVASTIAATENKECLDLFVQLDGLWFINWWLQDAQAFTSDGSDCFMEEAISALLQAVEKLQIDNERSVSSRICNTVKSLLSYPSNTVQDKAIALFNSWKANDADLLTMGVEKAEVSGDKSLNNEDAESQVAADGVLAIRSNNDQKLECTEEEIIKTSDGQGSFQKALDHSDSKDGCPDTVTSPAVLEHVEGDILVMEEVCLPDRKADLQCPSNPKPVTVKASSEVFISELVVEDATHDGIIEGIQDRLGKVEVSSGANSVDVVSKCDSVGAEEAASKPVPDKIDPQDELSVRIASSNDTNQVVVESTNEMDDSGGLEQKELNQGEGCSAFDEPTDQGPTNFELDVRYDEPKKHRKCNKKYSGKISKFSKLTKCRKDTDIIRQADMDLEDGTVDALDFARLVANEIEREVVGYDEQSDSSSDDDDRISTGSIRQPDSSESINGEDPQIDVPADELPTVKDGSPEVSEKEHLVDSSNQDAKLENLTQDMESSQLTDALRETEVDMEKSTCKFDLNQEFSSEEPYPQVASNPVSIVSVSTVAMAPGMPAVPIHSEGTLGWKHSAATSAFRPASPWWVSDNDKAFSGGAPSSGSRQRQDFVDIDLNVAEDGDDKFINPESGKQKLMLRHLPSGESSVELSLQKSERLNFDLNQIGEGVDVPASEWKVAGQNLGSQTYRRSPSPTSSSSCLQPMRNFDLNVNPSDCNNLSNHQPYLGQSSLHKASAYVGPTDDSVISILGSKVKKNTFPQTMLPIPNGRASEPMIDASLLGGAFVGLRPEVPYAHSVYGYNGLTMGPVVSFPHGQTYGPGGPIPYMFDSRGPPIMPQIISSSSTVPSSYCQPSLVMNMMGVTPGSNSAFAFCPNLDLNSGYAVESGSRDPAFVQPLLFPGHGRPLVEQQRDSLRHFTSGKRKEPDSGWELFPSSYKHNQPPHL